MQGPGLSANFTKSGLTDNILNWFEYPNLGNYNLHYVTSINLLIIYQLYMFFREQIVDY